MKLSQKIKPKKFDRVHSFIELIITTHPAGFGILLGSVQPPSAMEVHEMLNSQRSLLPVDFIPTQKSNITQAERIVIDNEFFNKIVKLAGGWPHINHVAQEFIKIDKRMWEVAADHVKFVANPSSRYYSRLDYIANKHGISRNTVSKYRKLFSQAFTLMLLTPDLDSLILNSDSIIAQEIS